MAAYALHFIAAVHCARCQDVRDGALNLQAKKLGYFACRQEIATKIQDAAALPLHDVFQPTSQRAKGCERTITSPWDETRRLDPINKSFGPIDEASPTSC